MFPDEAVSAFMKHALFISILVGLLAINASVLSADLAPNWSLASSSGADVRLNEEIEEQPVVLFFWATWCPYCKALMPHLQSIRLEYGDRIKILAINIKDDGDPVAFIENAGYDFTVLPAGDAVADLYQVYGTPGLIVVDRQGRMRFDLRDVPRLPEASRKSGHQARAAILAPYWASQLRTSLDQVLADVDP